MEICQSCFDLVRGRDKITRKSYQLLHFDRDEAQKTFCGGIITVLLFAYVIGYGILYMLRMIFCCYPYITSYEQDLSLSGDDQYVAFLSSNVSVPMVSIFYGGERVPLESAELNRDSRQYMHIKSRHVINEYNDAGLEKTNDKLESLDICTVEDFSTIQDQNFITNNIAKNYLCIKDQSAYVQGVFNETSVYRGRHSYIVIEVSRCIDANRNKNPLDVTCDPDKNTCEAIDPECESDKNIKEYLATKRMQVTVLNKKADFSSFDEGNLTRQSQLITHSIPLKDEAYSHGEFKVRRNVFTYADGWWPFRWCSHQDFYDIQEHYSDTFEVGKEQTSIAQFKFSLSGDEMTHTRIVYDFWEWLGDIGGVYHLLRTWVQLVIGGYLYFNQIIEIMLPLFSMRRQQSHQLAVTDRKGREDVVEHLDLTNFEISYCERLQIYILSTFGCFSCCVSRHSKLRYVKDMVDDGHEVLLKNFNIRNILQSLQRCQRQNHHFKGTSKWPSLLDQIRSPSNSLSPLPIVPALIAEPSVYNNPFLQDKSKIRRKHQLDEIRDKNGLRNHLIYNKWTWLKDGTTKYGYFEFDADGTYDSNFARGAWEVIDHKNFWFNNTNGLKYSLQFTDNYGEEAILLNPARFPQSKLRINYDNIGTKTLPLNTDTDMVDLNSIADDPSYYDFLQDSRVKDQAIVLPPPPLTPTPIPVKQRRNKPPNYFKSYSLNADNSRLGQQYPDDIPSLPDGINYSPRFKL